MNNNHITRRNFIASLSITLGTSLTPITAKAIDVVSNNETSTQPLLFTNEQLEITKIISEIIIPTTDTPGATEAEVYQFINKIISQFVTLKEQVMFIEGIEQQAILLTMNRSERITHIRELDENRAKDAFFKSFKQLTIFGYYTSEIGGKQELNYARVPGPYKEVPLSEIKRAWST